MRGGGRDLSPLFYIQQAGQDIFTVHPSLYKNLNKSKVGWTRLMGWILLY